MHPCNALVVVSDNGATIEDLQSKNGTYVDGIRVTGATPLADGAELRIGLAPVTFRRASSGDSTQTLEQPRETKR